MINCKKCGAPVPDGAPVCPNCRTQDHAPQPPKNNRKKLLIILFSLIGVLVALGVVIAVLLLNRGKSEVNTFDFTCSQYTAEMNRILGENKLDENKWVVNEASAVYTGPGYKIDLKTDKDSEKVTEIGISPAGKEDAAKMAAASIMVAEPEIDQKTALSELAELSEKKQDEIISVETVVKIDEEKESYVITPRPKDKPAKKSTPDEIATTTAPPTTIQPTTAPHEYTAEELLDKSLDEIIEIMGGDFECSRGSSSTAFGTDNTGLVHITNNDILPGIEIYPLLPVDNYTEDLSVIKDKIKEGGMDYHRIVLTGSAKYNDSFSADMTYNDIASQFGYRDLQAVGAERSYFYGAEINGRQVSFCFISDDELESHSERGYLSSDVLKEYNPTIHDIAVRHEAQETTTEEPTEEPTKAPSYSDYSAYLGSWSYTYTPDEIPEEILKDDLSYRTYMQHLPTTSVVFNKIDGNIVKFELCKGNISAVSDAIITAEIVDGVIDFEYIDSWRSNGHGTITLNGDSIHVYCVEDHHANGGRAQLNCDETLTRK